MLHGRSGRAIQRTKKELLFIAHRRRPIGGKTSLKFISGNPPDPSICDTFLPQMPTLSDTKTEKVVDLICESYREPIKRLLVVGCGDGTEAAILAQKLNAEVVGIDLNEEFDPVAARYCDLRRGNAMSLEFASGEFDFVFSYHALEHIEDPVKALGEMRRVLKDGGGFWVGTPNKSRMVGYVGGKNTSLSEKLRWNVADWWMRLKGRFENRFGAHAGFTRSELEELLDSVFSIVDDRTFDYFEKVYESKRSAIKAIEFLRLSNRIYPSVYFSGRR
jgi:ubiquinone/menaquinone biosynthesis C-methylase UbiE